MGNVYDRIESLEADILMRKMRFQFGKKQK